MLVFRKEILMLSRIFVRVVWWERTPYFLLEKKLLFSGDIELIPGPAETAEIPIVLTYDHRFVCSSSTYFGHVTGQIWPWFGTFAELFNGTNLYKTLIPRRSSF